VWTNFRMAIHQVAVAIRLHAWIVRYGLAMFVVRVVTTELAARLQNRRFTRCRVPVVS